MLAPKTRPGGVPHRILGVIFEVFEALGGLGHFGPVLRPCTALGRNMWSRWLQVALQDRAQIDNTSIQKVDPKIHACWDRFFDGCWVGERKQVGQKSKKNRFDLRKAKF